MDEDEQPSRIVPKDKPTPIRDDYLRVFNTGAGFRILGHLYQSFCISSFDNEALKMAFKEGQRSVVMMIMEFAGRTQLKDVELLSKTDKE